MVDLKGSMPALITPFGDDGKVDDKAFQAFVEWQLSQGTHGLVPVGTTGESPTLSHDEHKRVVELCVEVAAGRVPVVAGAGSNSTAEAIDFTRHAKAAGADAALVVAPYYNKPTQDGMFAHYKAVAESADIPIVVYNVPGRTVADILPDTMIRMANEIPNIVAIKDASADLARPSLHRLGAGEGFTMLSGEDATALGFNAHGGVGCISVTANVAPGLCARLQEATLAGDYATALALQDKLMPLHKALFMDPSPVPAKYACAKLGKCRPGARLPLIDIRPETAAAVDAAMAHAGLLDAA